MPLAIVRIALAQILAVVYCVLIVGTILKMHYDHPMPRLFATYVRDYGTWLFLVPIGWLIWVGVTNYKPTVETGDARTIFGSGVGLLVLLILIAFIGTLSACSRTHSQGPSINAFPST